MIEGDPNNNGRRPVAYLNETFLESPDARGPRILSEYLEPLSHFRDEKSQDTIVFFGSARITENGPLSQYYNDARTLARLITEWSKDIESQFHRFVICSGGGPGIMEAANRGAEEAGGKTIGLNIGLPFEQEPNGYITPSLSFEFHYFFMRKFWFAYLARALVIFPGGFGTRDLSRSFRNWDCPPFTTSHFDRAEIAPGFEQMNPACANMLAHNHPQTRST